MVLLSESFGQSELVPMFLRVDILIRFQNEDLSIRCYQNEFAVVRSPSQPCLVASTSQRH